MASRQAKKRAKRRRHRYKPQVGDFVLVNRRFPWFRPEAAGPIVERATTAPYWRVRISTERGLVYYDCFASELKKLTEEEEAAYRLVGGR